MIDKEDIIKAIEELKKEKKRKFSQSVDLIVNFKKVDLKRTPINLFITLPFKTKERKVCGFLTKESSVVDTITKEQLEKFKDKKQIRNTSKKYDYFISHASLMPKVATNFGRALGPSGKMPSPQLGIVTKEDDETIKETLKKINSTERVRAKQPSVKLCVGKESMESSQIIDNVMKAYREIENALPNKKDNVKSVLIKLTMSKPVKIQVK